MAKMRTNNFSWKTIKSNGYCFDMPYFSIKRNKTEVEYDVVQDIDEW